MTVSKGEPLRILVVVHDFQPGGTERIALRLASRWADDGDEVAVACGNTTGPLKSLVSAKVELFVPANPIRRSLFSRIAVARFAARSARAFKPDVIFLPGNFHAVMAVILKPALGRRCPAIVVKGSNLLRRAKRGRAGEAAFMAQLTIITAFADHLVAMSPELLDEARRSLPWKAARYTVVPEPVLADLPAVSPRHAEAGDDPPLLVAAGRLAAQKNFAVLLDAAAQLDRPFNLIIYGEGPQRAKLEASIKSLGLTERVTLAGYIDDLMPALSHARLFVMSSDYEGFPAVLIEALAAGVPVVTTDCSPAIAGIVAMADGILVPTGDPAALAGAIRASLDQPAPDRRRLAASVDRFRIGPSAAAYRDLFGKLASNRLRATANHRGGIDRDARDA